MASDPKFVDYVLDQIEEVGEVSAKKMFGEYGVYAQGKFFGLICDDKFFVKPTEAGRRFIGEVVEAPPYPGAKNSFLIEDKLDDPEWLCKLITLTLHELPLPKPKKKKKK